MMPPMVLRVRIHNQRRHFGLWVPLFPVVPLLILLALLLPILLLPFLLVAVAVFWYRGWGRRLLIAGPWLLLAGPRFVALFCALRGLEIDVQNPKEKVLISFR